MLKVSTFKAQTEYGIAAVPLFGPADSVFEKTAAPGLMPSVTQYINNLRPRQDAQYVLVNALGAGEYFGSNSNGDHFPEAALIHAPDGVTGNPVVDRTLADKAQYGYLTFYNAHPYLHHRNKNPNRAYGEVELSVWNDLMKRVELVIRVDRSKCEQFGGVPVWDKLRLGQFLDVSMGSKVPYDASSITLDWKLYREAQATFDPKKHKHPGMAVLEFHKKLKAKNGVGIKGVSITRNDYDEWCSRKMNQILPDGRKVFVYNDYPRFFDISFVFIGADRTAKVLVHITQTSVMFSQPSALVAEKMGLKEDGEKTASIDDEWLSQIFGKSAAIKAGELDKDGPSNLPPSKAVPLLAKHEPDYSDEVMGMLGSVPTPYALSTLSGLGMVLKPHEFAKITGDDPNVAMDSRKFLPSLARTLVKSMPERSALGPLISKRITMLAIKPSAENDKASSLPEEQLNKIGSAYRDYRQGVIELVAHAQNFIEATAPGDIGLSKLASDPAHELFTPLSYEYLSKAFLDEGIGDTL